jgi:hypothetical protein
MNLDEFKSDVQENFYSKQHFGLWTMREVEEGTEGALAQVNLRIQASRIDGGKSCGWIILGYGMTL